MGSGGEPAEHPVQDGGMEVVAAGVHHLLVFGAPCYIGCLHQGQGVDVGPEHHGAAQVAPAGDAGQHARTGDGAVFDAQRIELPGDETAGFVLPERELGVAVQVAAECFGCHGVSVQNTARAMRAMFSVRPIV